MLGRCRWFRGSSRRWRSDPAAEAGEFAVDASVAPGRVLGGEAEDESSGLVRCRWASRSPVGLCPVFGDAASVLSEEGVGGDDPAGSSWPGSAAAMAPSRLRSASLIAGSAFWRRKTASWWRRT